MKGLLHFVLILTASNITFSSPVEYEATYIFKKSGLNFAKSNHKMTYNSELDIWCINTESKTIGIFSLKKDVTAVEVDEEAIKILDKKGIKNIENLSSHTELFENIISLNVLEHIEDDKKILITIILK